MFLYAFSIAIPSLTEGIAILKEGIAIEKAYRTCKIIGRPRDCFHGIINHVLVAEMITIVSEIELVATNLLCCDS